MQYFLIEHLDVLGDSLHNFTVKTYLYYFIHSKILIDTDKKCTGRNLKANYTNYSIIDQWPQLLCYCQ